VVIKTIEAGSTIVDFIVLPPPAADNEEQDQQSTAALAELLVTAFSTTGVSIAGAETAAAIAPDEIITVTQQLVEEERYAPEPEPQPLPEPVPEPVPALEPDSRDCAGVIGGSAVVDNCGACDDDAATDCVEDCAGVWGGELAFDRCGVCGGDDLECGATDVVEVTGSVTFATTLALVNEDVHGFTYDFKASLVGAFAIMGVDISPDDITITDIAAGSVVVSYVVAVPCRGDCAAAAGAGGVANRAVLVAATAGSFSVGSSFVSTAPPPPPEPLPEPTTPEPTPDTGGAFVERRTAAGGAAGADGAEDSGGAFGSVNEMMVAVFAGAGFAAMGGCVLVMVCRAASASRSRKKVAAYDYGAPRDNVDKLPPGRAFTPPRRFARDDVADGSLSPERVPPMSRRTRLPPVRASEPRRAGGGGYYGATRRDNTSGMPMSMWPDQSVGAVSRGAVGRQPREPP
jgi:hypothetical protein